MVVTTVSWRVDARVIGAISAAHGTSHFFQLSLAPLFPLIREEFGVGYTQLGLVTSLFYAVSGLGQTAAGFVVDRWGSRPVLLGGLTLLALATLLAAFAPGYGALLPLAVLGGIGNSVFHPADFAVINARVSPDRLGRAYGAHGLAGNLGWVLAPTVGVLLGEIFGWRVALATMGVAGLLLTAALAAGGDWIDDRATAPRGAEPRAAPPRVGWDVLSQRPVLLCFAYFVMLSTAIIGLQTFSVPAMMSIHTIAHGPAAQSLTALLLGSSLGIIGGAFWADRTERHHIVAAVGLLVSAALLALVPVAPLPGPLLPTVMAMAGFAMGATGPSRDSIVRQATPKGSSGRVYGFVYSGLDLGSTLTPATFGWFIDQDRPTGVFAVVVVALLLAIATVLDIRRRVGRPARVRAAAQ